jgi:hypothetical protein
MFGDDGPSGVGRHVTIGAAMSWYYCLVHQRVEPEEGCANAERLGPYATEAEAQHALELAKQRNEAFDRDDE